MITPGLFLNLDRAVEVALESAQQGDIQTAQDICFEQMDRQGMKGGDYAVMGSILRLQFPEMAIRLYSRCLTMVSEIPQRQFIFGELGMCYKAATEAYRSRGDDANALHNLNLAKQHFEQASSPLRYVGQLEPLLHYIDTLLDFGEFIKAGMLLEQYVDRPSISFKIREHNLSELAMYVRGKFVHFTGRTP